jgi:hypothetical protein
LSLWRKDMDIHIDMVTDINMDMATKMVISQMETKKVFGINFFQERKRQNRKSVIFSKKVATFIHVI